MRANRHDSTRTSHIRLFVAEHFARGRRYARAIMERLRVPVGATSQVAVSACRLVNTSEVGLVPQKVSRMKNWSEDISILSLLGDFQRGLKPLISGIGCGPNSQIDLQILVIVTESGERSGGSSFNFGHVDTRAPFAAPNHRIGDASIGRNQQNGPIGRMGRQARSEIRQNRHHRSETSRVWIKNGVSGCVDRRKRNLDWFRGNAKNHGARGRGPLLVGVT